MQGAFAVCGGIYSGFGVVFMECGGIHREFGVVFMECGGIHSECGEVFMECGGIHCAEWSRKQEHEEAREHARGQRAKAKVPCAERTADRAPNAPNGVRIARVARLGRSAGASRLGGGAARARSDDERQTKERGEKGAATREGVRRFGLHPRRGLPAGPGSRGRRVRHGPSLLA